MSYRTLKLLTVLLPTLVIGGFEYVRHEFLLHVFSMEAGNWIITLLTLVISYLFSVWMFRIIERKNQQLAEEKARGAVYEERGRIAQELHDHIAQILFFLNVTLKQGQVEEARTAVSEIDNHLRQAIFNLRSLPEEGITLTARITKWLDEWNAISGIDVAKDIEVLDKYFSTGEEVQLFALIQEAFTNIRKHSQAKHAAIMFRTLLDGWTLEIKDDGIGLGNHDRKNKYGLSMMEKRANELNAVFEIMNQGSHGTALRVASRGKT